MINLEVNINLQNMRVFDNKKLIKEYNVSTARNGAGEKQGSEQTPRGLHIIRAKFGAHKPPNTIFVGRRTTGEIFSTELREKFPNRDWILTRIFWLSGLERTKNRESMRRHIYIHGTPDDVMMGIPGSRGCIRMRNQDIIELFDMVPVGAHIMITE